MFRATDAIIQSTVRAAVRGTGSGTERSMLVISHRVHTVLHCDQLLVLADGEVVQSGRPRVLAKAPGIFSDFVAAAHVNDAETTQECCN